jgi:AAA domain
VPCLQPSHQAFPTQPLLGSFFESRWNFIKRNQNVLDKSVYVRHDITMPDKSAVDTAEYVNRSRYFRKALKHGTKLRFAVCGPSGSGKTFTLLRLATELGGPIALIDTEHGSASKYADLFEFDVLELDSYDPLRLIELIDEAAAHRYRVLCIDSLSHFWVGKDGELDKVDRAARRMHSPSSFAAWKQITPIHNALIDKIISAPLHVLVSMRSKTEWVLERDDRTGKTVPRKVGLAPVMRDGIEYEFDVCGDMDQENTLTISKTRCTNLAGGVFSKPGRELADVLKDWLGDAPPAGRTTADPMPEVNSAPQPQPNNGAVNRARNDISCVGQGFETIAVLTEELAAIWKRMCSPRGVANELHSLRASVEALAGSAGVAEYNAILRKHGVTHPRQFRNMQPARLCAKDVYLLLAQFRANLQNQSEEEALEVARQETESTIVTPAVEVG